jgi:hypothetical protein
MISFRFVQTFRNNAAHMRRSAKSGLVVTSGLLVMRFATLLRMSQGRKHLGNVHYFCRNTFKDVEFQM